jgi:FkbM family methyltransferase
MRSQWLFEKLYLQSIRGMNYGSPHFWENGELKVMHYVDLRLSQCGKKHPVLFDIGANNGDYTRNLYKVFGRNASIHCYEPSTASFKILQKKIIDIDNIAAYPFCLGDAEETCTLFYDESTSTIASLHDLPINHPWKGYKSEQVQVKTLDSLCPQINVNEINFLKIDVEGHELAVLHGAQEMICNQKMHRFRGASSQMNESREFCYFRRYERADSHSGRANI